MKTRLKMLVAAVLVGGVVFGAVGQTNQIRLNATNFELITPLASLRILGNNATMHGATRDVSFAGQTIRLIGGNITLIGGTLADGDLHVARHLNVVGSKNFIHPHPTDSAKIIRYVAIESAEALTLVRGTAKTVNGKATITLPQHFSMVTSKNEPITVSLTPEGAPVLLYVKQKSTEQIVVAMRPSDFSEFRDVEFSFQVTGVRDGFEKLETIVDIDALNTPTPARDDVQKRIDALVERIRAESERTGKIEE